MTRATAGEVDRSTLRLGAVGSAVVAVVVALLFLGVAAANRLPILFPDTIGYNRAGEAILGVVGKLMPPADAPAAGGAASRGAGPVDVEDGISAARSPYYGLALATVDRLGGAWAAAAAQALVAAIALLLAFDRLHVGRRAAVVGGAVIAASGLAFYACALVPDVFLGPVILALAFLMTGRPMRRRERLFWVLVLVAGLLFHRSFLAVGLVVVAGGVFFIRRPWFDRRGWLIAAAATAVAVIGHGSVAPVVERVYRQPMTSQPFLLARMAEGDVLPAYLDAACPTKPYFFCRYRAQLPMYHEKFLWDAGPDSIFKTMSLADKQRLTDEANAIVVGAVRSDPVGAAVEAAKLSLKGFFVAGMDDFSQRVPRGAKIDPSLAPAMVAYPGSGIVTGTLSLAAVSRLTEGLYIAALLVFVVALAVVLRPDRFGRHREAAPDRRLLAAIGITFAGMIANAVVCATLSGFQDRYQGRIAWLASLAAVATLSHAAAITRRGPDPRT